MFPDRQLRETSFGYIGESRSAESPCYQHDGVFFTDPTGEIAGRVKMQFGKAHAVEMPAGELPEELDIRYMVRGFVLHIDHLGRKVCQMREKIAKLFDGKKAVLAAVVGDDEVFDGNIFFRHYHHGAFRCVQGFFEERIRLLHAGIFAEQLAANDYQVREPAFFGEEGLIPALVILMDMAFHVMGLAFAGEGLFQPVHRIYFFVPQLQVGGYSRNMADGGQLIIVQWAKE